MNFQWRKISKNIKGERGFGKLMEREKRGRLQLTQQIKVGIFQSLKGKTTGYKGRHMNR